MQDKRKKLTDAQVKAIRFAYAGQGTRRITYALLAARYGVDCSTVQQIVTGRSRKRTSGPRSSGLSKNVAAGQHNGQAKLSLRQVKRIRARYAAQTPRVTQAALAETYGVSHVAISLICSGKTWRGLTNE